MSWILISLAMGLGQTVPESAHVVWSLEFDRANDERGVEFGGDIATHQATAQGLVMDTVGSDPITYLPEFRIPTSPYQALEIVYECSRVGQGEIFYAHDRNTEYNGFSGAKQINVSFARTDGPTTMTLWPFWLQAPELIQLRLDPPAGVRFVLHAIRIAEVPVRMYQRAGGRPTTVRLGLIYHYARVLLTLLTRASRRRATSRAAQQRAPRSAQPAAVPPSAKVSTVEEAR